MKIAVPVFGLLFALTARADGPSVEERLTKLEVDVASIKQALSLKPATKGDVVVTFFANFTKGGQCTSLETSARYTKETAVAKVLKVLDCTKTGPSSYFKANFYMVQFADGTIGTFAESQVTPL